MKMTPLHLKILLHYYVTPELYPQANATAVLNYTRELLEKGLLTFNDESFCTTDYGNAWVRLILTTPLPIRTYADPRTGEQIK